MNSREIITKKRDGAELSNDEISFFIEEFTKGEIPDYQMSAFMMAVYFKGMTPNETFALTNNMLHSGYVVKLDSLDSYKVDKHSTGGIGDKISIVLAPLVASCGVIVPMMSGRGLGFSGGTLDKLESIPGFNTQLSVKDFKKMLSKIGVSMIGQTPKIAPADKRMYSLRDVTATVESIPLITASILSKKLAEGIDGLVMDVKAGSGAFMKTVEDARSLALSIKRVLDIAKKDIVCILSDMNEPLGYKIGNSLEVIECIEVLRGEGPKDVIDLTLELSAHMLKMAGAADDLETAKTRLRDNLNNGKAFDKFLEIVKHHGGDTKVVEKPKLFKEANCIGEIKSSENGYLRRIESEKLGFTLSRLGAGRERAKDKIDPSVGMVLKRKIGDEVSAGETLAFVHYNDMAKFAAEKNNLNDCFMIGEDRPAPRHLIYETID